MTMKRSLPPFFLPSFVILGMTYLSEGSENEKGVVNKEQQSGSNGRVRCWKMGGSFKLFDVRFTF